MTSNSKPDKQSFPKNDLFGELLEAMCPLAALSEIVDELNSNYTNAHPFPHAVVDDLFDPGVLDRINAEFPARETRDWLKWRNPHEDKTTSRGIQGLSAFTQHFFLLLNSAGFIEQLKRISGIHDLLPDPIYYGAGLQETFCGGWLNIHADYTRHPSLPLTRRLTLLLYLNRDWESDWHGELELWDCQTKQCAVSYEPVFNRMLLIPATPDALHGQPEKLTCPEDKSRRFVSVTYWTANPEAASTAQSIKWMNRDGMMVGPGRRIKRPGINT